MTSRRPAPISAGVIAASRRIVGPARVLRNVARVLSVIGLVGAFGLAAELLVPLATRSGSSAVVAVLVLVVLLAPTAWLQKACGSFGDLIDLPDRLQSLQAGTAFSVAPRDLFPSSLRSGGLRSGIRIIRTTVREVADAAGPASTVLEVVSPLFWAVTAAAAVAALVLPLVATLVGIVQLLG